MSDGVNRFLGDTLARVLIKLVLISLVVGVVMSAFHWTLYDIFYGIHISSCAWEYGLFGNLRFCRLSDPQRSSSFLPLFCPYPQLPEMNSIR